MMNKRFVSLMLALLLALALLPAALNEEVGELHGAIAGSLEDGSYVIRIPVEQDDLGWFAQEPAQDEAVKLAETKTEDGCFVVKYDPVHDGDATVIVRHFYCAAACDQCHGWYLAVRDGKIQEVTGGSYTAIPRAEEVDPCFSGAWLEKDTQFTHLTVKKNEALGWDVEIVSPLTHGAYKFVATVYQDAYQDGFVYDKGKIFDLPADYEEGMDLGQPAQSGLSGILEFEGSSEGVFLVWQDGRKNAESVRFEKAQSDPFEGTWVCGRAAMEINREDDGYKVFISWGSSAAEHSEWEYSCVYDAEKNALVSMPFGTRSDIVFNEEGGIASEKLIYEDGEATFTLDADGHLLWQDEKENAGEDMHFELVEILETEAMDNG